jgi:hypothetical protein
MFTHPGIQPRRKGQRYAKDMLPGLMRTLTECGGELVVNGYSIGSVEHCGTERGTDSYGEPCTYELLQVTLFDSGAVVPCYRRQAEPGSHAQWNICQDFGYTIALPTT